VEFLVSPPIVTFRESVAAIPEGCRQPASTVVLTANKACAITLRAVPLLDSVHEALASANEEDVARIVERVAVSDRAGNLHEKLVTAFSGSEIDIASLWCFGPRKVGPNILLNQSKHVAKMAMWQDIRCLLEPASELENVTLAGSPPAEGFEVLADALSSISAGFQLAMAAGPLCGESMTGVAIVVEEVSVDLVAQDEAELCEAYGPFSGQLIAAMREGCHKAILASHPRLTEPFYTCEVQVAQDSLGASHDVLRRRRGKVLDEDVSEATYTHIITASLPVVESFGLADELRSKTSGAASFQLKFSHWEMIDQDPFYKPQTEEELEEWGEYGDKAHNLARRYMDMTRRRKGLRVEEQVVQHAEKQRTMSRKK